MKCLILALVLSLMPLFAMAMDPNSQCLIKLSNDEFNLKNLENVKKRHNAVNPDPKIREIAEEALKSCGIKRNIVLLQRNEGNNSYTTCHPNDDQVYLAIGVKNQTLDQITGSIYHEIGHIANNHTTSIFNKWYPKVLANSVWPIFGYFLWTSFNPGTSLKYSLPMALGVATLKSIPFVLGLSGLNACRNRTKERQADQFGYKKLIEHKKITVALGEISDYIFCHENERPQTIADKIFGDYPSHLERAKIGIEEFQKADLNMENIVTNLPADMDQGLKNYLPEALKKYFPDLFKKK